MKALEDNDGIVRQAAYYALMYIMDTVKDEALLGMIRNARAAFEKENNG